MPVLNAGLWAATHNWYIRVSVTMGAETITEFIFSGCPGISNAKLNLSALIQWFRGQKPHMGKHNTRHWKGSCYAQLNQNIVCEHDKEVLKQASQEAPPSISCTLHATFLPQAVLASNNTLTHIPTPQHHLTSLETVPPVLLLKDCDGTAPYPQPFLLVGFFFFLSVLCTIN